MRSRLDRYYATEGQPNPLAIALPKGSYIPQFLERRVKESGEPKSPVVVPAAYRSPHFFWLAGGALAIVCAFLLGRLAPQGSAHPEKASILQFDVEMKSSGVLGGEVGTSLVLSPDGTRVVFISIGPEGVARLNTRRMDQSQAVEMAGTEGARGPFLSPDGRWVGFWSSGKLKKTAVDGGSPVVLCDGTDTLGATWGQDGKIIAALGGRILSRISDSGGPPSVILDLTKESATPAWPQILPGGKFLLLTVIGFAGPNHANIELLSLANGKRTVLVPGGTFGRYLPNGYLTYVNQGTLFAMPVDLARPEGRGAALPILEGVSYSSTFGFAEVDFSQTGILAYRKNNGGEVTAEWLDGSGKIDPLLAKPGRYVWPALSPRGDRLALAGIESGDSGVWIYDRQPGRITRVPSAVGRYLPIWSPDGRYLICGGTGGMAWLAAEGGRQPKPLMHTRNVQVPWSFTPDGTRLAYHELDASTGFDLWTVPIHIASGEFTVGKPEPFLRTRAFETYPSFSHDGHWIAYGSNESGNWEVYVRAFPDNGKATQVSSGGGRIARWSANGHDLFYRTDDQRIMLANYKISLNSFSVLTVRQWTPRRLADTGVISNFDLAPDGQRILALMPSSEAKEQSIENHATFILNFFDEVRRRVPVVGR